MTEPAGKPERKLLFSDEPIPRLAHARAESDWAQRGPAPEPEGEPHETVCGICHGSGWYLDPDPENRRYIQCSCMAGALIESPAAPAGGEEEERKTYCLWCGKEMHYRVGDDDALREAAEMMRQHDLECPNNPLVQENERLRGARSKSEEAARLNAIEYQERSREMRRYREALVKIAHEPDRGAHEPYVDTIRDIAFRALHPEQEDATALAGGEKDE